MPALEVTPTALELGPAAPNPTRSGTALPLLVGSGAETRIAIYAANGRLVRLLESGPLAPGRHVIGWDGRDGDGRAVASGAYFVRAEATGAPPARLKLIVER